MDPCPCVARPLLARRSALALVVLVGLMSTVFLGCKGSRSITAPPADSALAVSALHDDLRVLRDTLLAVHPAFADADVPADTLRTAVRRAQASVVTPTTVCAFYGRVAPLVTALNDGHTFVGFPTRCLDAFLAEERVFPFDVALTDSTAIVLRSYDGENIDPGARIVSINGRSVSALRPQLLERMPGARTPYRRQQLEGRSDTFKFLLWQGGIRAPFEVVLQDSDRRRTVEGISLDTIRARRPDSAPPPYAYRRLSARTGLMTLRSFEMGENDFDDFLDATFERLRRDDTAHLIIDVRDNGGGQSGRAEALLRYLAPSPVALVDTAAVRASALFKVRMRRQRIPAAVRWLPVQYLHPRGRAVWGAAKGAMVKVSSERVEPREADERFDGRVTVLINEGTFSTATLFAAAVKQGGIGTLIGRETGGPAGRMFAQPVSVQLPNTGLWLRVSTMRFRFGETPPRGPEQGVVPDHRVPRDLPAKIDGHDPVLDRARGRDPS